MKKRLDNIYTLNGFILNEAGDPYVWALFAGDSMNFGIGLYAEESEANEALIEYQGPSFDQSNPHPDMPHLERFNLSNIPEAKGLFSICLSKGAESLNPDMPNGTDQVKFLVSLGAPPRALFMSHPIENSYERLYGLFDGDLSWIGMSREEIERAMKSVQIRKNLF